MPKVYLSETDRLNAVFSRAYGSATAYPKVKNNEVAAKTGIPERTLYTYLKNPSSMRVSDLRAIARVAGLTRENISDFVLGKER